MPGEGKTSLPHHKTDGQREANKAGSARAAGEVGGEDKGPLEVGENRSPQLAANFPSGACGPAAWWAAALACTRSAGAWGPLESSLPAATSSSLASAVGSAFQICPTFQGHHPGLAAIASCHHRCPLLTELPASSCAPNSLFQHVGRGVL